VPPKLRCGLGVPENHASFTHLAELAIAAKEVDDIGSLSFDITAYEYGEEGSDYYEETDEDAASTDSDGRAPPPPPGEEEDDTESSWPSMVGSLPASDRFSERLSERLSASSERLSGELPPLLPPTPIFTASEMQELDELTSPTTAHRCRRVRQQLGETAEQTILSLDDVLARRDVAASVLTADHEGLPALPVHLPRDILDACIPIVPSLADFENAAKVDISACLAASSIDIARRLLRSAHAEVIAWLMRRSLLSSLVWGSVPACNPSLLELDASGNALGSRGAMLLGRALPMAPCLRHLRLNDCLLCSAGGADTTGLVELARGISSHPSLIELLLASNLIGVSSSPNVGLRALVGALSAQESSVAILDVGDNCLGCAGAELLARLVASQPRLRELRSPRNQLTGQWGKQSKGVRALAAAVAESASLEILDLASNGIGTRDVASMYVVSGLQPTNPAVFLVEALRINTSLHSLNLSANRLIGEQAERLKTAWASRAAPADGLRL